MKRKYQKYFFPENKGRNAGGDTLGHAKEPGKVSNRRKTHPGTLSSTEKVNVGSFARPTVSGEKRGSAEEVPTSRADFSVLDAILGPADKSSVPAGIKKSDTKRQGTVVKAVNADNRASRKHSNITDKVSERSGGEVLGVFKRPTAREKNTGFKIPRLSRKETDTTPAGTLSPNTSVMESVSTKDLVGTSNSSFVALESGSKDGRVIKQSEVVSARKKDTAKESKAETTSKLSKRKHDGVVSERKSDLVGSNVGIEVKKTLANALNSTKSPQQLPWSVSSKCSTSKSATPIPSESLTSNSSKCVPVSSGTAVPHKSSSVTSKSSRSSTSKSSTHVTPKLLPDTSKLSPSVSSKSPASDSSSKLKKSLDISHNLPSGSKKDEPHKIKSTSSSIVNSGKLDSIKADRETSASKSSRKSSETSSDRHRRAKELDKHGSKNDHVSSTESNDATSARKSRLENSRMVEAMDDRRASVSANVEKSSILETVKLGDKLVATANVTENSTLPDKQGVVTADATAADVAGQTPTVQQLSHSEKHTMQPLDRIRTTTTENQSKTRDKLLDNKQISRKKPDKNQPDMVPPVNELVENQLETVNKPSENLDGNTIDAKQTVSSTVRSNPERPCHSGFLEPALPMPVVRPLGEQNPKRGTREVVRTTAPALGREVESITLSQIVNDSIRKTGPMPSPLLSEVAPKKKVPPDVSVSNRPPERESLYT